MTATATPQSGFVFTCGLDGRGGCAPLEPARPRWYHLDYSQPDAAAVLTGLGLEAPLIEALIRPDSRPRTLDLPGGVLVILRGVNTNPGADPEDMVSLRLWIEPERLISVRQYRLLSVRICARSCWRSGARSPSRSWWCG